MSQEREEPQNDSMHPKVFISYSHDSSEHMERVLELSDQLRLDGVDCHIDQYEESPTQGWQRWMHSQIRSAVYVLLICTETYKRRFEGSETRGMGKGSNWEGAVITQELYEKEGQNRKFIPVVYSPHSAIHIPDVLASTTYYAVDTRGGYERLYRRLTNQPQIIKPDLGSIRSMPPRKPKSLFSDDRSVALKEQST